MGRPLGQSGNAALRPKLFRRKILIAAALLLLFSAADAEDLVVGVSAAFSGPSRGLGIELYRGSISYFEMINRQGGVHGKRISVKAYDDGYEPDSAIQNTIRLIEKDDVLLLFDYVGTPTVTRVLPLLPQYRDRDLFLFFPFTGAQPQRQAPYDKYVFNLRASYREETQGLVNHFLEIGRKRIAVFYQIDAYGRSGWDGVKRTLAEHGLKMVAEATYRRGTPFSESLQKQVDILKNAGPDAIVSVGSYAACAAFIRDARNSGWNVPIANVSFVGSENLLNLLLESGAKAGKNYTQNLINSQVVPSYEDTRLAAVREYRDVMKRFSQMPPAHLMDPGYKPLPYSFVSFEGFLNAKLLVEILRRMENPLDRKSLRDAVESTGEFDLGIETPVSFGPEKHQGLDTVYYSTVENGSFHPIKDWNRWKQ